MTEALLRRLGRDQWVRVHGTPRITVLAGGDMARQLWEHWVSIANVPGELLVGEPERCMRDALAVASRDPARPVAVHGSISALDGWRRGRSDRLAALYDEGLIRFAEVAARSSEAPRAQPVDAGAAARHEDPPRASEPPRAQRIEAHAAARDGADAPRAQRIDAAAALDETDAPRAQRVEARAAALDAADAPRAQRIDAAAALDEADAPRAQRVEVRAAALDETDAPRAQLFDARSAARDAADAPRTQRIDAAAALDEADAPRAQLFDARSAAEAAMYEALEATPATRGKFDVNGRLSVRFGGTAAEVDLIARAEGIAIEIDGYHHFTDAENYRRDRRKDLLLQTQGLIVVRVLAEDVVKDARGAIDLVCQALAYRLGAKT